MSKTPPSVRVARWAAVAAAITGLFTVGNTFIEKRPWFLGGEEEKPKVVESTPVPVKKVAHYEAPATIRFSIPKEGTERLDNEVRKEREYNVTREASTAIVASMGTETPVMAMSVAPDTGLWGKFLNFMYYRPIPFWTITVSLFFICVFFVTELLHHRKKNKDKTKWTLENPNYSAGPDIQKPLP